MQIKILPVSEKRKAKRGLKTAPTDPRDSSDPTLGAKKKKKKIYRIGGDSGIKIGTVGHKNPEGLKDAKKIKGKPHSSLEGRLSSKLRTQPLVVKFNKGGRANFRRGKGTGPTPGQIIKARKSRAREWWTSRGGPEGTEGDTTGHYIPGLDKKLREKRPHSSPEGRAIDVKAAFAKADKDRKRRKDFRKLHPQYRRKLTPMGGRPKYGIGTLVKKVITKFKTKPKGVFRTWRKPKAVTDVDKPFKGYDKSYTRADDKKITSMLKNLGDEIKAQPLPPKTKDLVKKLQKAYPHHDPAGKLKKAGGGRIGLKHGTSPQQHYLQYGYGPTKAKLRSGKPKIAKKGWA